MAQQFESLTENHIDFIQQQAMYITGTAGAQGLVNVSPKGIDSFRVIDDSCVAWLNLTGSGNESAAHVLENQRMTIMFCSFAKRPLILRLYGSARVVHPRDPDWNELYGQFDEHLSARQIFVLSLSLVQTSCGYGVPEFELKGQRTAMHKWAEDRGEEGIRQYWTDENQLSMDGKETGIF